MGRCRREVAPRVRPRERSAAGGERLRARGGGRAELRAPRSRRTELQPPYRSRRSAPRRPGSFVLAPLEGRTQKKKQQKKNPTNNKY